MFKKIVEFFTGKKPQSKFAHPLDAVTTPTVSAPYKLEPPAATTPIPYVPEPPLVKLGPEPTPVVVEAPAVVESAPAAKPKRAATPKAPKAAPKSKKV